MPRRSPPSRAADNGTHTFSHPEDGRQPVHHATTPSTGVGHAVRHHRQPGAASRFRRRLPLAGTAGVAGSFTVTAEDAYGNRATGYTGTVRFTSSDGQAALPGQLHLHRRRRRQPHLHRHPEDGRHPVDHRHGHRRRRSRQAGDHGQPRRAASQLLSAPASVTGRRPFSLTVTVVDAYGNVVTGYPGTVHFTQLATPRRTCPPTTPSPRPTRACTPSPACPEEEGKQTITITDALLSFSNSVDVLPKKK